MKPLDHAHRSVARYGGTIEDYLDIHEWLDQTKGAHPDMRHRAILHNSMGPFIATSVFGRTIEVEARPVDVRQICEDHIIEDLGRIPSVEAILSLIPEEHMGFFAHKRTKRRNYD